MYLKALFWTLNLPVNPFSLPRTHYFPRSHPDSIWDSLDDLGPCWISSLKIFLLYRYWSLDCLGPEMEDEWWKLHSIQRFSFHRDFVGLDPVIGSIDLCSILNNADLYLNPTRSCKTRWSRKLENLALNLPPAIKSPSSLKTASKISISSAGVTRGWKRVKLRFKHSSSKNIYTAHYYGGFTRTVVTTYDPYSLNNLDKNRFGKYSWCRRDNVNSRSIHNLKTMKRLVGKFCRTIRYKIPLTDKRRDGKIGSPPLLLLFLLHLLLIGVFSPGSRQNVRSCSGGVSLVPC